MKWKFYTTRSHSDGWWDFALSRSPGRLSLLLFKWGVHVYRETES